MSTKYDEAVTRLKKENIRITPQRVAILEFLASHPTHPTAEEIYRSLEVHFPGISVATVYNNLRLFTDIGFVKEMKYGDASSRFDFTTDQHYHAICNKCGKISDFYYPGLEDIEMAAGQLTGYQINSHRLEVYGLCPICKEEELLENEDY